MSELSEAGSNRSEMSEGSADPGEEQRLAEFKVAVKRLLSLPAEIKVDNEPVKEKKEELKQLQEYVKEFMIEHETPQVKVSNTESLVLSTTTKLEATKAANWEQGLRVFCQKRGIEYVEGDNGTFDEYRQDVDGTREQKTTHTLKRVKRGTRAKKKN